MKRIIKFSDEEMTYATIETEEEPEVIEKLLNEYREFAEHYSINGFLDWLKKEKKIKFKVIPTEEDYVIYF